MHADERRVRWTRTALFIGLSASVLVPLAMCGLLRFGLVTPAEFSLSIGPMRIATNCLSRKVFCVLPENANPAPDEIFILINWPGGDYAEDILVRLPLR
jgi:hypothetical protein